MTSWGQERAVSMVRASPVPPSPDIFQCFFHTFLLLCEFRCHERWPLPPEPLGVRIEIFRKADQSREFMDLQKVLDPFYILVVDSVSFHIRVHQVSSLCVILLFYNQFVAFVNVQRLRACCTSGILNVSL